MRKMMFLGILSSEKQTQFRSAPGLVRGLPVIVATAKRSGKHPASYNFALVKSRFGYAYGFAGTGPASLV